MEIAEHIDALRRQGEWLADAAERAGLDAPVPPCAPWQVKDLLRHTGYVHRWAARHITECPDQIIDGPSEEEILSGGADDAEPARLVPRRPRRARCRPWPRPIPRSRAPRSWPRRPRWRSGPGGRRTRPPSTGPTRTVPPARRPTTSADFAADGIDELIMGFGRRRKYQPDRPTGGTRLRVLATDTGDAWLVEALEGRLQPRRDARRPGGRPGAR